MPKWKDGWKNQEKSRVSNVRYKLAKTDFWWTFSPLFRGEHPNTYVFTKGLAEQLILDKGQNLPLAVVRPSIVVAAWKYPVKGWVDNLNGPTGCVRLIKITMLILLEGWRQPVRFTIFLAEMRFCCFGSPTTFIVAIVRKMPYGIA